MNMVAEVGPLLALCCVHSPHSFSRINAQSKAIKFFVTRIAKADQIGQLVDVHETQSAEKKIFAISHLIVNANVDDMGSFLVCGYTIAAAAKALGVVGVSTRRRMSRAP